MRYIRTILETAGLLLTVYLIIKNACLTNKLAIQTDKHWSANMQIAHYSDELRKHEAVKAIECERRNKRCIGCPFDRVVCNEQH